MQKVNLGWHAAAIQDYEQSGLSIAEIAQKYDRDPSVIRRLIRHHDVTRKVPVAHKGGRRRMADLKPLSPRHRAVGVQINRYRTMVVDLNVTALADQLGINRLKVTRMEQGVHDFTLMELMKLEEALGIPLFDLMTPVTPTRAARRDDRREV